MITSKKHTDAGSTQDTAHQKVKAGGTQIPVGGGKGAGDKTVPDSVSSCFLKRRQDFTETQVMLNEGRKYIPSSPVCF